MADLGMVLRPEDVPAAEFDAVPAGDYMMQVIDSKVAPTKTDTGKMLTLIWEIMSGPMERRMVFGRLNIVNASEKAQAIGQRELANICEAMGIASIQDSEQLHFIPIMASVGIREDKTGQYGPQNVIKKYWPINAAPAAPALQRQAARGGGGVAGTPPAQQSQPVQQARSARPWSR